jgi:hypothetical protein
MRRVGRTLPKVYGILPFQSLSIKNAVRPSVSSDLSSQAARFSTLVSFRWLGETAGKRDKLVAICRGRICGRTVGSVSTWTSIPKKKKKHHHPSSSSPPSPIRHRKLHPPSTQLSHKEALAVTMGHPKKSPIAGTYLHSRKLMYQRPVPLAWQDEDIASAQKGRKEN